MSKELTFRDFYNHDIRKANPIATSAAFDYTLIEEKLVDFVSTLVPAPQIEKNGDIKYPLLYEIYYNHFCKCMGKKGDSKYYKNIDQAIQNLHDKSIKLIMKDGKSTIIAFIERATFSSDTKKGESRKGESRKVIIKLDDRIIPILIEKRKNYFEHHPEYTMFMDSKYSIRLYQWFLALLNKKISVKKSKTIFKEGVLFKDVDITKFKTSDPEERKMQQKYLRMKNNIEYSKYYFSIPLESLKDQLSVSDNYRGYKTIKNKIIDSSIDEINDKTDISVDKDNVTIDENNNVIFPVQRKDTITKNNIETELFKIVEKIKINPNEISHVIEDEAEYQVEQYFLIEQWADTM